MAEETTAELLRELAGTNDPAACIRRLEGRFIRDTVPSVLTALYRKRTISKAELARRSGVSQVYLHQVFAGRRTPSRDRLLCLCFGLGASLEETQYLLRVAVSAPPVASVPAGRRGDLRRNRSADAGAAGPAVD